jgi:hypothetical protein
VLAVAAENAPPTPFTIPVTLVPRVIFGVVVGLVTDPVMPFALAATDTLVTVPVPPPNALTATFFVTPLWTIGTTSVPASGVVAAGSAVIVVFAMLYSKKTVAVTVPLITTYRPELKYTPPSSPVNT